MSAPAIDFSAARRFMAEGQIKPNDITDQKVLRAFFDVPRETFLNADMHSTAYAERAIPLNARRAMLKPLTLAKMLQALEIGSKDNVLDIGGAPGYTAAILASVAASVTVLEEDEELFAETRKNLEKHALDNVQVVKGSLKDGYAAAAPYDAIILEGAIAAVPEQFIGQLKEQGHLIAIMGEAARAKIVLFTRIDDRLSAEPVFDSSAPLLPGFEPLEKFVF